MAKYIHTIALKNEFASNGTVSGTRESARQYAACVVATYTAEAARLDQGNLDAEKVKLAEACSQLATLCQTFGLSVDEAQEKHLAARKDARVNTPAWDALWDHSGYYSILAAEINRVRAEHAIAWHSARLGWAIGSESAIAWSGSVSLAHKAMGANETWAHKAGYTLAVRTDIQVRERATRKPKAT